MTNIKRRPVEESEVVISVPGASRGVVNKPDNFRHPSQAVDSVRLRSFRAKPPSANSASASRIRSSLLNKLGIAQKSSNVPSSNKQSQAAQTSTASSLGKKTLDRRNSFHAILKADHGIPDYKAIENASLSSSSSSSLASSTSSFSPNRVNCSVLSDKRTYRRERGVSFDTAVEVQLIPMCSDYSNRIRQVLWTDPKEMQATAARNCLEFAAEGWDWRNVANDEDMIVVNGESIHPIHFRPSLKPRTMQDTFATVMAAPQHV